MERFRGQRQSTAGALVIPGIYSLNNKDQFAYGESRLDVLNQGIVASDHYFEKSSDIVPASSYFTQPGVVYTGTTDQKLYKIKIQKWFALFYTGCKVWMIS